MRHSNSVSWRHSVAIACVLASVPGVARSARAQSDEASLSANGTATSGALQPAGAGTQVPAQVDNSFFTNGAAATSTSASPAAMSYFSNGADATSVYTPGQSYSTFFSDGAQMTSVNGAMPAPAPMPVAIPVPVPQQQNVAEQPNTPTQPTAATPGASTVIVMQAPAPTAAAPAEPAPVNPNDTWPASAEPLARQTSQSVSSTSTSASAPMPTPAQVANTPVGSNVRSRVSATLPVASTASTTSAQPSVGEPIRQDTSDRPSYLARLLDIYAVSMLGYLTALVVLIAILALALGWRMQRTRRRKRSSFA